MTFYFFSTRLFENDFRRPLIKSLIAKGHEAWHVRIGRENILTGPGEERTKFNGIFGFVDLIKQIRSSSKISRSRLVFVDTTGAFVPIRSLLLRAALRGLWCIDIFDNLLYDLRGVYRLKRRIEISLLARLSSIRIVLSRETLRLFPRAYHLENAAHVGLANRAENSFNDLVCLSMIDRRFDFTLVKELVTSAPELRMYLYGRVDTEDRETKLQFEELCTSSPNLIYRGEYRFEDVDAILASFGVGFTPYTTSGVLTEFINPDKYYLYLNSGMEVISTDIPQARRMADFIHIARSAGEIVELVARIQSEPAYRKNKFLHDFSWERRVDDLIKIIQSHERTIASDAM